MFFFVFKICIKESRLVIYDNLIIITRCSSCCFFSFFYCDELGAKFEKFLFTFSNIINFGFCSDAIVLKGNGHDIKRTALERWMDGFVVCARPLPVMAAARIKKGAMVYIILRVSFVRYKLKPLAGELWAIYLW